MGTTIIVIVLETGVNLKSRIVFRVVKVITYHVLKINIIFLNLI